MVLDCRRSRLSLAPRWIEFGAQLHHRYKHGDMASYKPQRLIDFYRFYKVNPEYGAPHIRINSAGFRNVEEILPEKSGNVFRIVLMGGSTVWGDDAHSPMSGIIANEETIAALLERILNARGVSMGSPPHNTSDQCRGHGLSLVPRCSVL